MTSSKSQDVTITRTAPSHRASMSTSTPAAYPRQMHPRTHSHSLSVGSINPAHRVSRRKSMTATNKDTVMTAMAGNGMEAGSFAARRASKGASSKAAPAFPASLPSGSGFAQGGYEPKSSSAIVDGPSLATLPENEKGHSKARTRRASEGSRLSKGEGKRTSGAELRCEKCGKGYKHSSCLTKHLWEHTPEWQYTSKLLISKHQQVQLLEAASVLVAMNKEGTSAIESDDSSSPAASGSSDPHDDEMSSAETTPPPEHQMRPEFGHAKRYSENSSVYSQSYQSSVFSESAPSSRPYMSHYRQWSTDGRPTTSGTSVTGSYKEDGEQMELTAAVGLLSCSYGTPKSGPVMLPADVPPVPPLPAQFLGQKADHISGGSSITITGPSANYSCIRGNRDADVEMEDDEFDHPHLTRGRSDEDDEGMFGKMEE